MWHESLILLIKVILSANSLLLGIESVEELPKHLILIRVDPVLGVNLLLASFPLTNVGFPGQRTGG